VDASGWAVAEIPLSEAVEAEAKASAALAPERSASEAPASTPPPKAVASHESQRYGESVLREVLGASFIEEQVIAPRVTPRDGS
jgi:DNA polymerase-3 subunit gamma/tau